MVSKRRSEQVSQMPNKLLPPNNTIRIAGITRIRNEESIIDGTLDWMADFCNAGIFVYDDASTDDTGKICFRNQIVRDIFTNPTWVSDRNGRQRAEGYPRKECFDMAVRMSDPEWVFCFDADERPELDLTDVDMDKWDGIRLRLFDYYITPEDVDKEWLDREWIGPEYRDILMMVRASAVRTYVDREPYLTSNRILHKGYVKHWGKARSVEEFEDTCDYYANHLPEPYASKWAGRRGKAVKSDMKSDFGNPLIRWDERKNKGFLLTPEVHRQEFNNVR